MKETSFGLIMTAGILSICSLLYEAYHLIIGTRTISEIFKTGGINMIIYIGMTIMFIGALYEKIKSMKKSETPQKH